MAATVLYWANRYLNASQKDKRLQRHIVLAHEDDQALPPADQQRREQREASGEQQRRQGPPAIRDQRLSGLPIVKPQQGLVVSHAEHPKDGAFQRHDPERGQREALRTPQTEGCAPCRRQCGS